MAQLLRLRRIMRKRLWPAADVLRYLLIASALPPHAPARHVAHDMGHRARQRESTAQLRADMPARLLFAAAIVAARCFGVAALDR